jgi:hypothetical protein
VQIGQHQICVLQTVIDSKKSDYFPLIAVQDLAQTCLTNVQRYEAERENKKNRQIPKTAISSVLFAIYPPQIYYLKRIQFLL